MSKDAARFALAKQVRERKLANAIKLSQACACTFPLDSYRNLHGHGDTVDGQPCPAITIWQALRDEREATKALNGDY